MNTEENVLRDSITPNELCKEKSDRDLVKEVNYLIGYEIFQGNHAPITAEFVAASLHISLSEATAALKAVSGK